MSGNASPKEEEVKAQASEIKRALKVLKAKGNLTLKLKKKKKRPNGISKVVH